jgi:hypothetical protein
MAFSDGQSPSVAERGRNRYVILTPQMLVSMKGTWILSAVRSWSSATAACAQRITLDPATCRFTLQKDDARIDAGGRYYVQSEGFARGDEAANEPSIGLWYLFSA